ncbi:hypothetical protein [Nocardioides sp. SYSU D00038]|uniref:hypothetical protein n=1 Tax=Nocardioides sp. SYSU D00038 TaxID=2812554 RepID=UPI0019681654|nr:hypothetical protein [Nocardioides sp. SYSU D00038]
MDATRPAPARRTALLLALLAVVVSAGCAVLALALADVPPGDGLLPEDAELLDPLWGQLDLLALVPLVLATWRWVPAGLLAAAGLAATAWAQTAVLDHRFAHRWDDPLWGLIWLGPIWETLVVGFLVVVTWLLRLAVRSRRTATARAVS